MTKSQKNETHLLNTTNLVDLILDEGRQMKQARKLLGEDASMAQVRAETARRMERARELNEALIKPLGTSSRPFPMYGTQRVDDGSGGVTLETVLSVIADDANPMKVYSERPYKEVIALAYCDLPVPTMLPLFFEGLERRKPESTNRTQMMIGKPGAGKSFLGGLQGRIRSNQSVEVFDCGGKNMNDLLFEMVLDFGKGDGLPVAIDKRLKAGALHELSITRLKQLDDVTQAKINEAQDKLDGKFKPLTAEEKENLSANIERWEADLAEIPAASEDAEQLRSNISNARLMIEGRRPVLTERDVAKIKQEIEDYNSMRVLSIKDGNIVSIDWNALAEGGQVTNDTVTEALRILNEVANIEGLDKAGGNALGMNSQYGPLIRWFIEGREGVLDEYNKSKEGSDNALQTVWQFFIGEIDTCTVENPLKNKDLSSGPASFTFRREDMKAGCFVTLTGNQTEDGLTTRSLNKSVYSRLSPKTLPEPELGDWQHRICQMMVGFPVSTWYNVFEEQADADPEAFGEWMLSLRKAKAEIEGVPVPELQENLLQNWQNVLHASEKLARFYKEWAEMTDAENLMATDNMELIEEVDEEYSKKEGIDFRKIKQHIEEAIPIKPRMQPKGIELNVDFTNFDKQPVLKDKELESPSVAFGTRLVEFLENMIQEKSEAVGKKALYEKLQQAMKDAGLREVSLAEAARSGQRSVEEDLNITVYDSSDLSKQAVAARKVFCDHLRAQDSEITTDDEQIITIDRLRKALAVVRERDTAETKELFIINNDYETLMNFPLTEARIAEGSDYDEDAEHPDFTMQDMVTHEEFMASLALPTVSAKNLAAIWDTRMSEMAQDLPPDIDPATGEVRPDVAIEIAENRSSHGIATTTLRVAFEDAAGKLQDVSVHVVLNSEKGKALVVGEHVSPQLQAAFKEAGIIHIDRHEKGAKSKIDAALNQLTSGIEDETVKNFVKDAFGYRNDIDLGRFMLDKKVITPAQHEAAREQLIQELIATQGSSTRQVGDILVSQGVITAARMAEVQEQMDKIPLSAHMVDDKLNMSFGKYLLRSNKKLAM